MEIFHRWVTHCRCDTTVKQQRLEDKATFWSTCWTGHRRTHRGLRHNEFVPHLTGTDKNGSITNDSDNVIMCKVIRTQNSNFTNTVSCGSNRKHFRVASQKFKLPGCMNHSKSHGGTSGGASRGTLTMTPFSERHSGLLPKLVTNMTPVCVKCIHHYIYHYTCTQSYILNGFLAIPITYTLNGFLWQWAPIWWLRTPSTSAKFYPNCMMVPSPSGDVQFLTLSLGQGIGLHQTRLPHSDPLASHHFPEVWWLPFGGSSAVFTGISSGWFYIYII